MHEGDRDLLARAFAFALDAHAGQERKGTGAPYACHLLQVSGLVLEHGGDSVQAAAGLLHDVVEDCGVAPDRLSAEFGDEATRIVVACTDLLPGDTPNRKSPWPRRKQAFLERLQAADLAVRRVVGCDKLDNLRSLMADLEDEGVSVFSRFNASPGESLWYYREVALRIDDAPLVRVRRELELHCESLERWTARVPDTEPAR